MTDPHHGLVFALLSVSLLASPTASAGVAPAGEILRIYANDYGTWNDPDTGGGLQLASDGDWVDMCYAGIPYQLLAIAATAGGAEITGYASGGDDADRSPNTDFTDTSIEDISDRKEAGFRFGATAGPIQIVEEETWPVDSSVVLVQLYFTNTGRATVDDLVFFFSADPDQDAPSYGSYTTHNDVEDLDEDGLSDWAQSVGYYTPYVIGFGACEPADSELGHNSSWTSETTTGATLADYDGGGGDYALGLRYRSPRSLASGATIVTSLLVSVAANEEDAAYGYIASTDRCVGCDLDHDLADGAVCGGDDCDDTDAAVYPGAEEIWYDGVDQDCSGGSDFDQDRDSFDAQEWSGTDCDDTDIAISPGAAEIWYDGVDQDCSGGSDFDQDGDGHDSNLYKGDDCDDLDPTVWKDCEDTGSSGDDTSVDSAAGDDTAVDSTAGDSTGEPDTGAVMSFGAGRCGCASQDGSPEGLFGLGGVLLGLGLAFRRRSWSRRVPA
jgi:MYXO-CTERM domain-containing protein